MKLLDVARLMTDPRVSFVREPEGLVPLWVSFSKRDDRDHLLWTDDYLAASQPETTEHQTVSSLLA